MGCDKQKSANLWYFDILPQEDGLPQPMFEPPCRASLTGYSAYDLPSVEALVNYFHAPAYFPAKAMWLATIKEGNYV